MDDLWGGLVRLLAQTLLAADGPVRIGIDDKHNWSLAGTHVYGRAADAWVSIEVGYHRQWDG